MTWVAVAVAGGIGALLRDRVGHAMRGRASGVLVATAGVNLAGVLLLAVLLGARAAPEAVLVLGTGLAGGLTTFSTWLVQARTAPTVRSASVVVVGQVAAGLLLAWAGISIGSAWS